MRESHPVRFLAKNQVTAKNKPGMAPTLEDGGSVRRKCPTFVGSNTYVSSKKACSRHQVPRLGGTIPNIIHGLI